MTALYHDSSELPHLKMCSRCYVEKPVTQFYKASSHKSGYSSACKECMRTGAERQEIVITSKACRKCGIEKPFDEFYENKGGKYGYTAQCKACILIEASRHHQEHYEPRRPVLPEVVSGGKVCRKCHIEKPLSEFSLRSEVPNGRRSHCKQCESEKRAEEARARGAHLRLPRASSGGKICTRCRVEKSFDAFQKEQRSITGYSAQCKICLNKKNRVRYGTSDKEQKLSKSREWYNANRERHRELTIAWKQENRLQYNEYGRRRRAKQKSVAIGEIDYVHILERDGEFCYICEGVILPEHSTEFDHVIPITRGGPHSEDNIRLTHLNCNRRKSNKLLVEMSTYQRRGVK